MQVQDSAPSILDFWPTTAISTYAYYTYPYENTSYWSQPCQQIMQYSSNLSTVKLFWGQSADFISWIEATSFPSWAEHKFSKWSHKTGISKYGTKIPPVTLLYLSQICTSSINRIMKELKINTWHYMKPSSSQVLVYVSCAY